MPIITPQPFIVPAHEEHGIAVMPARNMTEPTITSTDIGGPRIDRTLVEMAAPLPEPQEVQVNEPQSSPAPVKSTGPLQIFYFQIQSAELEPDATGKAKGLNPKDQCYLVVGHADPTGTPRMIGPLSVERARSVAQLLRSEGAKLANETGDGAVQPPKDADAWPQERRAEVFAADCTEEPSGS